VAKIKKGVFPRHTVNLSKEAFNIFIDAIKNRCVFTGQHIKEFEEKFAALADQPSAAQTLGLAGAPEALSAKAVDHLRRADSMQTVDPSLHYSLGRMLLRKRDYAAAVDVLRRLQDEQPGVSDAALMLADALLGQGRAEEAQKTLEAAVADAPEFVRGRVRLAEAYERSGRWADAAEQYSLAAIRAPRSGEMVRRQATALLRAGRPAAARSVSLCPSA